MENSRWKIKVENSTLKIPRWKIPPGIFQVENQGGKSRWKIPGGKSRRKIKVDFNLENSRWKIKVENQGGKLRWKIKVEN